MTDETTVTQADRDFAAKHTHRGHGKIGGYTFSAEYMIRNGHWDDDELVRDAARYRLAAEQSKDAEIAEARAEAFEEAARVGRKVAEEGVLSFARIGEGNRRGAASSIGIEVQDAISNLTKGPTDADG